MYNSGNKAAYFAKTIVVKSKLPTDLFYQNRYRK